MNRSKKIWGVLLLAALLALVVYKQAFHEPKNVFDLAFETFGLQTLMSCPGFEAQFEIFRENRDEVVPYSDFEGETLKNNWLRFVESERGSRPDSCDWAITSYPAGFIVVGEKTVIVINPSSAVIGAQLPQGTTGDFVMDFTRYSTTSLGAFRGAATIPPRTIAVISLR